MKGSSLILKKKYNYTCICLSLSLQSQLSSLPPLVIPKHLVRTGWRKTEKKKEEEGEREGEGEGEGRTLNQTDQEKSIAKETANLLEVCQFMYIVIHVHTMLVMLALVSQLCSLLSHW